jgi:uncharacterized protein (TIGR02452 family)
MFILVNETKVSSLELTTILEKLGNPYNDTDNLFSVKSVKVGNYTIATNGSIYDTLPNLKMVCKSKIKPENIEKLYNELSNYSNFRDNIDAIKDIITKRCSDESFCIAALNNNGDYIIINDKSGMYQVYSGSVDNNPIIYSTYQITTYFKDCINVSTVKPISSDNLILCLNDTIKTIKICEDSKDISIAGQAGKGVMSGDLINDGMDSIFGPLLGNTADKLSSIEHDMKPNKNGISIFDKIVQWSTVQSFLGTDTSNAPKSTNIFYDKNFFNHHVTKKHETVIKVVSEDWIDKALEMKNRGIDPVILNMTDKVFPAVDIHLGLGGQEESIFRISNLNQALVLDKFYPFNNDNRVIYSKDVTIYYGSEKVKWELLKEPKKVSIISCPPVKSPYNLEYDYTRLFENSKMCPSHIAITRGYLENTLQAAIKNGHDGIVLPAFGCEGQKNPPRCIAEILRDLLDKYSGYFREVYICVPDADERLLGNYNMFKEVLEKKIVVNENTTEVQLDNILDEMN